MSNERFDIILNTFFLYFYVLAFDNSNFHNNNDNDDDKSKALSGLISTSSIQTNHHLNHNYNNNNTNRTSPRTLKQNYLQQQAQIADLDSSYLHEIENSEMPQSEAILEKLKKFEQNKRQAIYLPSQKNTNELNAAVNNERQSIEREAEIARSLIEQNKVNLAFILSKVNNNGRFTYLRFRLTK